jgi:hypothetical protein
LPTASADSTLRDEISGFFAVPIGWRDLYFFQFVPALNHWTDRIPCLK